MTEVNGTGYPRTETPMERDRRAHPIVLRPARDEDPQRGDSEWREILRGLGISAALVLGFFVLPGACMAVASGDWPLPRPARVAAALLVAGVTGGVLISGVARTLHARDVDWR